MERGTKVTGSTEGPSAMQTLWGRRTVENGKNRCGQCGTVQPWVTRLERAGEAQEEVCYPGSVQGCPGRF